MPRYLELAKPLAPAPIPTLTSAARLESLLASLLFSIGQQRVDSVVWASTFGGASVLEFLLRLELEGAPGFVALGSDRK